MAGPKKKRKAAEMENRIAATILTPREKILIRLLFESYSLAGYNAELPDLEERIHSLTDYYDLDCPNMNYLLMLAVLGFRVDWKYYPSEIVPRLKGIHRYYQAKNVLGIPWLLERLSILRSHDIPVMLIKGLALRYYYIPHVPRAMNDYDIAVPKERFSEAMELLRDGSVRDKGTAKWSDSIIGKCAGKDIELDVHQWIYKHRAAPEEDIWARALPFDFYGIDVLVPSMEDMLIHILDSQAGDIFSEQIPETRLKWLFDCGVLMLGSETRPDYKKAAAYSAQFRTQYTVRLMLVLFIKCYGDDPYVLRLANHIQPATKKYTKWLKAQIAYNKKLKYIKAHDYDKHTPVTPARVFHLLSYTCIQYRAYRLYPRNADEKLRFLPYLLEAYAIHSWKDFYERILFHFPALYVIGKKKKRESGKEAL